LVYKWAKRRKLAAVQQQTTLISSKNKWVLHCTTHSNQLPAPQKEQKTVARFAFRQYTYKRTAQHKSE